MAAKTVYRIPFINEGRIYEIYAKKIAQGSLLVLLKPKNLSSIPNVVDPTEEREIACLSVQ